jgi:flagellar hook-basal body complex protein FliE
MRVTGSPVPPEPIRTTPGAQPAGVEGFAKNLSAALQEVNRLQLQATAGAEQAARGADGVSLDRVLADAEEAGLALHMTVQFRNKALEAYQEVMRMQF